MDQSSQSKQLDRVKSEKYMFLLFVAGEGLNSRQARQNLTTFCSTYLHDLGDITIVDVLKDFQQALEYKVFVTPTLILVSPLPRVTIVGNLNDTSKVLAALRIAGG